MDRSEIVRAREEGKHLLAWMLERMDELTRKSPELTPAQLIDLVHDQARAEVPDLVAEFNDTSTRETPPQ